MVNGDVRQKYFQVGSTWSSLIVTNQQAGTIRLSNATMETYTQATSISPAANTSVASFFSNTSAPGDGLNCFSCHDAGFDTSQSPAPGIIILSHVFGRTIAP